MNRDKHDDYKLSVGEVVLVLSSFSVLAAATGMLTTL